MLIAPKQIASSARLLAIGSCSVRTILFFFFFSTRSRFCSVSAVPHPAVGLVFSYRLQLLPLYCLPHRVSRIASRGVAPSGSTITWASLPRSCPPPSEETYVTWHSSCHTHSPPFKPPTAVASRWNAATKANSFFMRCFPLVGWGRRRRTSSGRWGGRRGGGRAMLRVFKLILVGFSNS